MTIAINATSPCIGLLNSMLSPKVKFINSKITNFEIKSIVHVDKSRSIFACKPDFF